MKVSDARPGWMAPEGGLVVGQAGIEPTPPASAGLSFRLSRKTLPCGWQGKATRTYKSEDFSSL